MNWNTLKRLFRRRRNENEKPEKNQKGEEWALDEILMVQDRQEITRRLIEMGNKTYSMLERSLIAVESNDDQDAWVILKEDREVNRLELEIDWECLSTMAMRQPVHDDLRFLFAIFKMTTDIERIGDESCNIARHLLLHRDIIRGKNDLHDVYFLLSCVLQQFQEVLEALENNNLDLAHKVLEEDKIIDEKYSQTYNSFLENASTNDASEIRRQSYILTLLRHLERVGDHIVNLADYLGYLLTGQRIDETHLIEFE